MTIREIAIDKYGSINSFLDKKLEDRKGKKLPISRQYFYKLFAHKVDNPGIKSLNAIADLLEIPREIVYKEFSK